MLWYMRFSVALLSDQDYLHFVFANTTTPPSSFPSISFSAGLESTDTRTIVRAWRAFSLWCDRNPSRLAARDTNQTAWDRSTWLCVGVCVFVWEREKVAKEILTCLMCTSLSYYVCMRGRSVSLHATYLYLNIMHCSVVHHYISSRLTHSLLEWSIYSIQNGAFVYF